MATPAVGGSLSCREREASAVEHLKGELPARIRPGLLKNPLVFTLRVPSPCVGGRTFQSVRISARELVIESDLEVAKD